MNYAVENITKNISLVDRIQEQEALMTECVLALENVVAKIAGSYPSPTTDNTSQDAVALRSLYGKLNDHEEFLRTVIGRVVSAVNSLNAGL